MTRVTRADFDLFLRLWLFFLFDWIEESHAAAAGAIKIWDRSHVLNSLSSSSNTPRELWAPMMNALWRVNPPASSTQNKQTAVNLNWIPYDALTKILNHHHHHHYFHHHLLHFFLLLLLFLHTQRERKELQKRDNPIIQYEEEETLWLHYTQGFFFFMETCSQRGVRKLCVVNIHMRVRESKLSNFITWSSEQRLDSLLVISHQSLPQPSTRFRIVGIHHARRLFSSVQQCDVV